jgi:hypothetical protein
VQPTVSEEEDDSSVDSVDEVDGGISFAAHKEVINASETWIDAFLASFAALRERLAMSMQTAKARKRIQQPSSNDRSGWRAIVFSGNAAPSLRLVLGINEVVVRKLVQWYAEWLGDTDDTRLNEYRCQWLFVLFARLDAPLHDDTGAAVRRVFRAALLLQDAPDTRAAAVIICTIAGRYFGQQLR